MSLYRYTVVNGVLQRHKRALLRWWVWTFNRSEEDRLTTMKNKLVMAHQMAATLTVQIKQETERISKLKGSLQGFGNVSPPWRDRWSRRKEPVILQKDINVARKKKERVLVSEAPELARVVFGRDKFQRK